jgi:fido (protein-threonine AMPylation protein)
VILFELVGREDHPVYQSLEVANGNRQYDFLRSMVVASLQMGRPFLSQQIVKALNFQAIACLHVSAGEYRPGEVVVGDHHPPEFYRVIALMDDFINMVNRQWETADPLELATFVLWRLNYIHPFINGNGRTARAACYFVLCVKAGGWLPGSIILPELLRRNRAEYVAALQAVDASVTNGSIDMSALHALVQRLLEEQLGSAGSESAEPLDGGTPPAGDE